MKTLKLRIKDKHISLLDSLAHQVNFVWNYANNLRFTHFKRTGCFFSSYDINKYTAGSTSSGLSLHSQSVQMVSAELVDKSIQHKKIRLSWRVSYGPRRSLGWIPFSGQAISYRNGQVRYAGHYFSLWDSYGLSNYELRSGSFNQDSRGRWYINICVKNKAKTIQSEPKPAVGVDLGLKTFATMSDGTKLDAQQAYRKLEHKLKIAQRANQKVRVRAIHAKIRNVRKEFLHQQSTKLTNSYSMIVIGNVSSSKLAKTKLLKSVLDAGWSTFRTLLKYKCDYAGVKFVEVNESYTTQTCSSCGSLRSSPKGRIGLGIRVWTCECGITHDRDVNAAKNILALGYERLAEGKAPLTGA